MKRIALLGSTGSIGTQALDVVSRDEKQYAVTALTAGTNARLLEEQVRRFRPRLAVLGEEKAAWELKGRLADTDVRVAYGEEGLLEAASMEECDMVLNALVGVAGLQPTVAALEAGHTLALANKESLVCGGARVMELAQKKGVSILPVDSEHSAIFQSMGNRPLEEVRRVLLTASGGPFFGKSREELRGMTAKEALRHPNWSMGKKITVDSATMMNKGFEVMEAVWLFGLAPEQVEVLVHRESILHSAVEFRDGCVMAQLSEPDMRLPIQLALTWPQRQEGAIKPLDLTQIGALTFQKPDRENFPCLSLCEQAIRQGGDRGAVINGANEVAVALFLEGKIGFLDIYEMCAQALRDQPFRENPTIQEILEIDKMVRAQCLRSGGRTAVPVSG